MKIMYFVVYWLAFPVTIYSQTVVEFPKNRMVLQRDLSNQGEILVAGYTNDTVDNVEFKFVPFSPTTGIATDWVSCEIFYFDNKTNFQHTAKINAGWYTLKIRVLKGGQVIDFTNVERVGVGEVFVIAGQSNAQGQPFNNSLKATDQYERVSIILGLDEEMNTGPSFNYQSLESGYIIYPVGFSSWCWGELGDSIVSRLNVPVMFLNAAWGGTTSEDWAKSIDNLAQKDPTRGYIPYRVLQRTLQFYRNIFGFRAVLWHQGESDTFFASPPYFENIKKVIETTRTQVNANVPWVVSKVSFILGLTNQKVLDDQQRLIDEIPDVFAGPYTDTIQNVRDDNIHFTNNYNRKGLTKLALAWNHALNDSFFVNVVPLLPDFTKVAFRLDSGNVKFPDSTFAYGNGGLSQTMITDQHHNFYICGYHPCKSAFNLISDDHTSGNIRFTTLGHINASNRIISGKVTLDARSNIELKPGFEVNTGSVFTAKIGGCMD